MLSSIINTLGQREKNPQSLRAPKQFSQIYIIIHIAGLHIAAIYYCVYNEKCFTQPTSVTVRYVFRLPEAMREGKIVNI